MPAYRFDELTTPLTPAEVEARIYNAITARGVDPHGWRHDAPTRSMIAGVAIVISAVTRLTSAIAKGGFLDLAEGDWLSALARHLFEIERFEATYAAGDVIVDNAGGGDFRFDPGDLIVVNPTTGRSYRNTGPVAVGPHQTGVVVGVRAVEPGAVGSSPAGGIVAFETPQLGLSVTQPAAIVGFDAESDADLRERCRAKIGSLSSNGPRDAYEYVARSAKYATGESIGVTRVRTFADGLGGVDVYVATASGSVGLDELAIVDSEIQARAVPFGVTARVHSAVPVSVAVTYQAWVPEDDPRTNAELRDAIRLELGQAVARLPIGGIVLSDDPPPPGVDGRLYPSTIAAAIERVVSRGSKILRLDITAPSAAIDLDRNQAVALSTVTGTMTRVPRA